MAEATVTEAAPPSKPTEICDENFPESYLPYYDDPDFQPPLPNWKPPEDDDALKEAHAPHGLPRNIEMAYGPPLPWIEKMLPPVKSPTADLPVREYLTIESVYALCLEALKLIVIERPERPVKFVAIYIHSMNPLACKVNCRRHAGKTCHCKNVPPPLPPPPPPKPKEKKEELEEEEAT